MQPLWQLGMLSLQHLNVACCVLQALDVCLARPWKLGSSSVSLPTVVSISTFEELQELIDAAEGPATFVLEAVGTSIVANQPLYINKSDITIAASQAWLIDPAIRPNSLGPATLQVSCASSATPLLQIDQARGVKILGLHISGCGSSAIQVNTSKAVVLRGCHFTANVNLNNGGAVEAVRSQLWVDGCSFSANLAGAGSGGAIFGSFSQLLVSDSRFGSNSAAASGGAVAMRGRSQDAAVVATVAPCWTDTDAFLVNNSFTSNRAKLQGGVLATNGSRVIVQGATASYNKARYGGVAYLGQTAQLTVRGNSSIFNNTAASSGGVVYAVSPGARVVLNGSTFTNNTAKILGGVVSAKEAASVRLEDCLFNNNTADLAAGVVYVRDADMTATGCTFNTNSAKRDGGALYCAGGCIWKLKSCTFRDNQCGANGGAMFGWNVQASISSSSLDENSAGSLGGGVAVANSTLELKSCKLGSNNAYGSDAAGGGVYSQGSNVNLTDCYMAGNVASWGGAVYITNSTLALVGGGIANSSATGSGAGMYVLRSSATVTNTTLSYNDAQQHGGTVYCSDSSCTLVGCDILGDSAAQGGGCIWVGRGSLALRRSHIVGCVSAADSGGGVYAAAASAVSVSGCSFKGCSALKGSGGALWLSGVHAATIRGSLFAQNQVRKAIQASLGDSLGLKACAQGSAIVCRRSAAVAIPKHCIHI
jgi:predicted outer membrane repeat protein